MSFKMGVAVDPDKMGVASSNAGATGATGATGPTGPTGPAGTPATPLYVDGSVPGGNTIASTNTETAFASSYTVLANTVAINTVISVQLTGVYGTAAIDVTKTLRLKIKVGSVTVLDTGDFTTVLSLTNQGWTAFGILIVRNAGASGTVESQGAAYFNTTASAVSYQEMVNAAAVSGIDWTANQTITAKVDWGTSDSANTITLRQMIVGNN